MCKGQGHDIASPHRRRVEYVMEFLLLIPQLGPTDLRSMWFKSRRNILITACSLTIVLEEGDVLFACKAASKMASLLR